MEQKISLIKDTIAVLQQNSTNAYVHQSTAMSPYMKTVKMIRTVYIICLQYKITTAEITKILNENI